MAGTNQAFDAALFRSSIHLAMGMGAAPNLAEQPLFVFPVIPTAGAAASGAASVDAEWVPFDPDLPVPLEPSKASVRVPCGLQYHDTKGDLEPLGVITQSQLTLTLLDVDYTVVEGFDHVMIDGDRYNYARTEPPRGLFEVGVYRIHCIAEDEA